MTDTAGRSSVAAGPSRMLGLGVAIGSGLAIGALTAYGQGWLNGSTTSLVNSAGPWSVVAFVIARYNRHLVTGMIAAMVTLACCELGYVIATDVRGGTNSRSTVVFWLVAALLAGPPLGVAGAWAGRRGVRRSVGFAVVGGVLVGEGWYGWTTIADTTDWRYWAVELLVGVVIVAAAAVVGRRAAHAVAAIGMGAATAVVVFAAGRMA